MKKRQKTQMEFKWAHFWILVSIACDVQVVEHGWQFVIIEPVALNSFTLLVSEKEYFLMFFFSLPWALYVLSFLTLFKTEYTRHIVRVLLENVLEIYNEMNSVTFCVFHVVEKISSAQDGYHFHVNDFDTEISAMLRSPQRS